MRKRSVSIEVWDTGVGIPTDQHERVFEEFYQIDKDMTGQKEGVGLGLSVVRMVAEAHKGNVWIEHNLSGRGSVIILTLPSAKTK